MRSLFTRESNRYVKHTCAGLYVPTHGIYTNIFCYESTRVYSNISPTYRRVLGLPTLSEPRRRAWVYGCYRGYALSAARVHILQSSRFGAGTS
jgi:hypothetical protein